MVWIIQDPLGSASTLKIEPLAPTHDRAAFVCLDPRLTEYMQGPAALQDAVRNNATVYVCADTEQKVVGYFTLSSYALDRKEIEKALKQAAKAAGIPWDHQEFLRDFKYPTTGVTLLGRIAIHQQLKGKGFGVPFIAQSLRAAYAASQVIASKGVFLDAKNPQVAEIYQRLGFRQLPNTPLRWFIPMQDIKALLRAAGLLE